MWEVNRIYSVTSASARPVAEVNRFIVYTITYFKQFFLSYTGCLFNVGLQKLKEIKIHQVSKTNKTKNFTQWRHASDEPSLVISPRSRKRSIYSDTTQLFSLKRGTTAGYWTAKGNIKSPFNLPPSFHTENEIQTPEMKW